jgi:hypothetical protein
MTTNFSGSAKIYTFPARGRFAAGNSSEQVKPAANISFPRGVRVASGSAWYHEEAIQEANKTEPARKN